MSIANIENVVAAEVTEPSAAAPEAAIVADIAAAPAAAPEDNNTNSAPAVEEKTDSTEEKKDTDSAVEEAAAEEAAVEEKEPTDIALAHAGSAVEEEGAAVGDDDEIMSISDDDNDERLGSDNPMTDDNDFDNDSDSEESESEESQSQSADSSDPLTKKTQTEKKKNGRGKTAATVSRQRDPQKVFSDETRKAVTEKMAEEVETKVLPKDAGPTAESLMLAAAGSFRVTGGSRSPKTLFESLLREAINSCNPARSHAMETFSRHGINMDGDTDAQIRTFMTGLIKDSNMILERAMGAVMVLTRQLAADTASERVPDIDPTKLTHSELLVWAETIIEKKKKAAEQAKKRRLEQKMDAKTAEQAKKRRMDAKTGPNKRARA